MNVATDKKCLTQAKNAVYSKTKNPSFLSHQETLHKTTFIDLTRMHWLLSSMQIVFEDKKSVWWQAA